MSNTTQPDRGEAELRMALHEDFQETLADCKPEWMMDQVWSELLDALVSQALDRGEAVTHARTHQPAPQGAEELLSRIEGDEKLRMDGYYIGFGKTGVVLVDRILSAVASAGKAYHNTDCWYDETPAYESVFRGKSPVDWIQAAANDAADLIRALPHPSVPDAAHGEGELLPCPFCGRPATAFQNDGPLWEGGCATEGCVGFEAILADTKLEAIAAWNRRAEEKGKKLREAADLARSALDNLMGDTDIEDDNSLEMQAMQALNHALAHAPAIGPAPFTPTMLSVIAEITARHADREKVHPHAFHVMKGTEVITEINQRDGDVEALLGILQIIRESEPAHAPAREGMPGPKATKEGIVRELNKALDEIERGEAEIISDIDATTPPPAPPQDVSRDDAVLAIMLDSTTRGLSDLIESENYPDIPAWVKTMMRGVRHDVVAASKALRRSRPPPSPSPWKPLSTAMKTGEQNIAMHPSNGFAQMIYWNEGGRHGPHWYVANQNDEVWITDETGWVWIEHPQSQATTENDSGRKG